MKEAARLIVYGLAAYGAWTLRRAAVATVRNVAKKVIS